MNARDELASIAKASGLLTPGESYTIADAILAAGYAKIPTVDYLRAAGWVKPRTITTAEELENLPHGSAVQTSDESDTVVLKDGATDFRNQSGYELSATDLWRYGTHPLTVLYEPSA